MHTELEISSVKKLPKRITVKDVISSRYIKKNNDKSSQSYKTVELDAELNRPKYWNSRISGVDIVRDDRCEEFVLYSDGQQSVPKEGWILLLTAILPVNGNISVRSLIEAGHLADSFSTQTVYSWTLYGMR